MTGLDRMYLFNVVYKLYNVSYDIFTMFLHFLMKKNKVKTAEKHWSYETEWKSR